MNTSTNQAAGWQDAAGEGPSRADAVRLLAIGVAVSLAVPFLFMWMVGRAQDACLDLGAGGNFFLSVAWVGLVVGSACLFGIGVIVARRLRLVLRVGAGLALVLVLCLIATWQLVPWGSSARYPTTVERHCGPGGIPTWWPPFLPHH